MSMQPAATAKFGTLKLDYPLSLGVFEQYAEAQKAVDTLADNGFPVENCLIVGTDLKQLERVTGRLTWAKVLIGGALSGLWLGLFVGLIFSLFGAQSNVLSLLVMTALFGALFGAFWSAVGYAFTRRARDFTAVSQVVATKYEVFAEHKVAAQGREILTKAGLTPGYVPPTVTEESPVAHLAPSDRPPMPPTSPSS